MAADTSQESSGCRTCRPSDLRRKRLITCALAMVTFSVGWLYGLFGTALPDLERLTETDLQQVSLLLTMQGVGRAIGGLTLGYLYDRTQRNLLLLTLLTFTAAAATSCLPWSQYYRVFIAVMVVCGFTVGGITCGSNTTVVCTWGKQGRQFMQFVHFCYAFGGVISPLVAAHFFAKSSLEEFNIIRANTTGNGSYGHTTPSSSQSYQYMQSLQNLNNETNMTDLQPVEIYGKSLIFVPFAITGALFLVAGVGFLCLVCRKEEKKTVSPNSSSLSGNKQSVQNVEKKTSKLSRQKTAIFLVLVVILRVAYTPVEFGQQSYLMTFVTRQLHWSHPLGAVLTSVLWAAFGFGRLLGIIIARYLHPTGMLYASLCGILLASAGQFAGGYFRIRCIIWIFVPVSGISMSWVSPTLVTWVNENVVQVSGKVSSIFAASTSTALLICPLYIGFLIDKRCPMWYIYIQCLQCAASLIIFTILVIGAKRAKMEPKDREKEPLIPDKVN